MSAEARDLLTPKHPAAKAMEAAPAKARPRPTRPPGFTAERHCYCGCKERDHDEFGVCHGKKKGGAPCWLCRDGFTMSGYDAQAPTLEVQDEGGIHERKVEKHPSFAQITAMRVSGSAFLYGSDFKHQHYITLQIHRSELHRQLAGDYPMTRERVIEVALSEAQWAQFVSSLNVGSGSQCTITLDERGMIPAIAQSKDRRSQFSEEMTERFAAANNDLAKLERQIDMLSVSTKKKEELKRTLGHARSGLGPSLEFIEGQFDEHMERTVEAAKSEVNAYAGHVLASHALQLAGAPLGESPIKMLTSGEETDDAQDIE